MRHDRESSAARRAHHIDANTAAETPTPGHPSECGARASSEVLLLAAAGLARAGPRPRSGLAGSGLAGRRALGGAPLGSAPLGGAPLGGAALRSRPLLRGCPSAL